MLRVLIVDDHPDTADSISMLLEAVGHETMIACTGADGVSGFQSFGPDLVILDIGLPDISGYEVARAIRALPLGASVYLVAATGWGTPEDRLRALAAGFDQHLLKPIDLRKLQAIVVTAEERITSRDRVVASGRA